MKVCLQKTIENRLTNILNIYNKEKSALIHILQDIQNEFRYLPKEVLQYIAEKLEIPLSQIYSVANFYNAFSLKPRGKHLISVCLGTACHVRGAALILDEIERTLEVKRCDTTRDMKFSLETVNCLGACALGPVVVIDGKYHGHMTGLKMKKLLAGLQNSENNKTKDLANE